MKTASAINNSFNPIRRLHLKKGIKTALGLHLLNISSLPSAYAAACEWALWKEFAGRYIQPEGRVVDWHTPTQHTTSEGQSYALFFALIAQDRATFDRVLRWTIQNLAGGDLARQLPSWQWGRRQDNTWGILDANPASDSDLWIAYCLLEAGRLWRNPTYTQMARQMLYFVITQEMLMIPGLGPILLPGPQGFALPGNVWRINPSYMPLFLLRRLAAEDSKGPWTALINTTQQLLQNTAPRGFSPDWAAYSANNGWISDPIHGDIGSYDAIRVYLWAGMTARQDPQAHHWLKASGGMLSLIEAGQMPPEKIQTRTGGMVGAGPIGFSAALLPYLRAYNAQKLIIPHESRVRPVTEPGMMSKTNLPYYDAVLTLFGLGWLDGRFRFNPNGMVSIAAERGC